VDFGVLTEDVGIPVDVAVPEVGGAIPDNLALVARIFAKDCNKGSFSGRSGKEDVERIDKFAVCTDETGVTGTLEFEETEGRAEGAGPEVTGTKVGVTEVGFGEVAES
jgi:hypothetical protein